MTRVIVQSDVRESMQLIKSAVDAEIRRLELGLKRTKEQLAAFESRYGVSSQEFRRRFSAEDLGGSDETYVTWAGEMEMEMRILQEIERLRDIEYVAQ
ncbi:MAG: hypothetical protein ACYC9Y_05300 [Candidatus Methylomirabilia bacterium]